MNEQTELENERYLRLTQAFMEAILLGMSTENMKTMKFETGFLQQDFDKLKEKLNALD